MGADYSFYVKTIETHARALLTLTTIAIGRVNDHEKCTGMGFIGFIPKTTKNLSESYYTNERKQS